MSELLRFIASYDDVINFCDTDVNLARRFQEIFAEAQERKVTFDPIMSAASNPDVLSKPHDLWTKKYSNAPAKRGIDTFDADKYTRFFIKHMKRHVANSDEVPPLKRDGFDPYAYLMEHEDEIDALYGKSGRPRLEQAALHYVESGKDEADLDVLRYIASYDDLTRSLAEKTGDRDELVRLGLEHYTTTGRAEILSGARELTPFFDATKYIASYAHVADNFKNDDGTLDKDSAAVAYITWGASNGLTRSGFMPYVYIANNLDLIKEDIYTNGEISFNKVAKLWINRFKDGVRLDRFDPIDFKETMELGDEEDPWKAFVDKKVAEYKRQVRRESRCLFKIGKWLCAARAPRADDGAKDAADGAKDAADGAKDADGANAADGAKDADGAVVEA